MTSGSRMSVKSKTPGSWKQREHKADRDRRKLIHEAWPHCASRGATLFLCAGEDCNPQISQMFTERRRRRRRRIKIRGPEQLRFKTPHPKSVRICVICGSESLRSASCKPRARRTLLDKASSGTQQAGDFGHQKNLPHTRTENSGRPQFDPGLSRPLLCG
jgi:hypothetical protein